MANWRKKLLPLAEWIALQDRFADLQMATRAPENLAMFIKGHAADPKSTIFITGPGIEAIEAHSPGDWEDSEAPSGDGVSLLVSSGDAWEFFGIAKPVI